MSKMMIAIALVLVSVAAHGETQLACWNIYAKRGSAPILKADIGIGNALKISLNLQDSYFEQYIYNEFRDGSTCTECTSSSVGTVEQFNEVIPAVEITTKRSSYVGNNSYDLVIGKEVYTFRELAQPKPGVQPRENEDRVSNFNAKLILPKDLSADALKTSRIRSPQERSNAVMIIDPSPNTDQGGQNYLRMFCVSR